MPIGGVKCHLVGLHPASRCRRVPQDVGLFQGRRSHADHTGQRVPTGPGDEVMAVPHGSAFAHDGTATLEHRENLAAINANIRSSASPATPKSNAPWNTSPLTGPESSDSSQHPVHDHPRLAFALATLLALA
jgi:hypothetical protein